MEAKGVRIACVQFDDGVHPIEVVPAAVKKKPRMAEKGMEYSAVAEEDAGWPDSRRVLDPVGGRQASIAVPQVRAGASKRHLQPPEPHGAGVSLADVTRRDRHARVPGEEQAQPRGGARRVPRHHGLFAV